jgi:hypothetical protein
MKRMIVLGILALAGCGVDGAPVRPSVATTIGVGDSGVHTATRVSATAGRMTVGVGVGG